MSASSSGGSDIHQVDGVEVDPESIARKIHTRLSGTDDLAVKNHKTAVVEMLKLKQIITESKRGISREAKILLLYAGINAQRRILINTDNEFTIVDLKQTLILLFMLQMMKGRRETNTSLEDEKEYSRADIKAYSSSSIYDFMQKAVKKTSAQLNEDDILVTPEMVCQACATICYDAETHQEVEDIANLFFRCSGLSLAYNMLGARQPREAPATDFLTLSSVVVMTEANTEERLETIASAGESEIGQQIFRDTMLSFLLPQSMVSVRRTVLVLGKTQQESSKDYPEIVSEAHDSAMKGATWMYNNSERDIVKVCALLAGLAMLLLPDGSTADEIRLGNAFSGRLRIPYYETPLPPPGTSMLTIVPHTNSWILYEIHPKSSQPIVHIKATGLEGLGRCLLKMTAK